MAPFRVWVLVGIVPRKKEIGLLYCLNVCMQCTM